MKFGPERRVRKGEEFQSIAREGRRVPTKHFVLILARTDDPTQPPRLGVTASRKTGNSVRRSRLKRLMRQAFRETDGLLLPGFDLVVICRVGNPDLTTEAVVDEWKGAKKRLNSAMTQLRSGSTVKPGRPEVRT